MVRIIFIKIRTLSAIIRIRRVASKGCRKSITNRLLFKKARFQKPAATIHFWPYFHILPITTYHKLDVVLKYYSFKISSYVCIQLILQSNAGGFSIEEMAPQVREFVVKTMEDLKRTRHWLRHTKYELCVACTLCSRECTRHVDTPCSDDDDCLHLIPVQDGYPGCNKTLEPMSEIPGFHPWFPSTKRRKTVIADRSFLMMVYLQSLSFFLSFFFVYLFMID